MYIIGTKLMLRRIYIRKTKIDQINYKPGGDYHREPDDGEVCGLVGEHDQPGRDHWYNEDQGPVLETLINIKKKR